MKKILFTLLLFNISYVCFAQVVIPLEKSGGVYKIPCLVNGMKMKFVFDTGASRVSLSESIVEYMLENDYLNKEDILGVGTAVVADGREVKHLIISIEDIEIAGLHLKDVEATVIKGQQAPLLLGQSAIQQLGRYTIEGNQLIIHRANEDNLSDDEIIELYAKARDYANDQSYAAAIDILLKIQHTEIMTENSYNNELMLWQLARCYRWNKQGAECVEICNQWIEKYDFDIEDSEANDSRESFRIDIYESMADSYYFNMENYRKAILWYQKLIPLIEDNFESWLLNKSFMANCYKNLKDYMTAISLCKEIIKEQCEHLGVTIDDVKKGKVKDDNLGSYLFLYASTLSLNGDEKESELVVVMAADCGYKMAIEYIKKYNIPYDKVYDLFD